MRIYRYRRIIGLLALGAVAAVSIGAMENPKQDKPVIERVYIVKEGDTLWRIADECIDDTENIQEFIYDIKKSNPHVADGLQAGQKIVIKGKLAATSDDHQSMNIVAEKTSIEE